MVGYILTSSALGVRFTPERHPLERIILPSGDYTLPSDLTDGYIWWVERRGAGWYLRAKLVVEEVIRELDVKSGAVRVVCQLNVAQSERISWPGTPAPLANITRHITHTLRHSLIGPATTAIADQVDQDLARLARQAVSTCREFAHARSRLRRVFADTHSGRPPLHMSPTAFTEARKYVKAYFARVELITVEGCDPYDVAAAILVGYEMWPEVVNVRPGMADMPSEKVSGGAIFQELDDKQFGSVEKSWQHTGSPNPSIELLERRSRHHQEIVRQLACQMRCLGLRPTYSRLVDLRVDIGGQPLFFEVKTTTSENFGDQLRRAVGQLLEYRFRHGSEIGGRMALLVAVLEAGDRSGDLAFAQHFLASLGIRLVVWHPGDGSFEGLTEALAR